MSDWIVPGFNDGAPPPPKPSSPTIPATEGWQIPDTSEPQAPAAAPLPSAPVVLPDAETRAKKEIADHLAPRTGGDWNAIANSTDGIAEQWTGQKIPATGFVPRVRNTFEGLRLQGQADELAGKQYLGDNSPETEAKLKDVEQQQARLGPTLGNVPNAIVGMAYQLGYQGYHAAGTVVDTALSVLSGEILSRAIGLRPDTHFLEMAEGESSKVFGSLVGGSYRSMVRRGIDPTAARAFAGGLGAVQAALMSIPIGGEAAGIVGDALAEGTMKTALKGGIDEAGKVASYLGMDSATAKIAGAFGKQALVALGASSANAILPEVAASLTNRARSASALEQERTGNQNAPVKLKSAGEVAGQVATGFLEQFLTAAALVGSHEALRSMIGDRLDAAVQDAAAQAAKRAEPEAGRNPTEKTEPETARPPQGIEPRPASEPAAEPAVVETRPEEMKFADVVGESPKVDEATPVRELVPEEGMEEPPAAEPQAKAGEAPKAPGAEKLQGAKAEAAAAKVSPAVQSIEDRIAKLQSDQTEATTQELKDAIQGKLDQAQKDLKLATKQAVVDERARVKAAAVVRKAVKDIFSVNPAKMYRDLGDAVRGIQEKFQKAGSTPKSRMTDEHIGELNRIHFALANLPEEDRFLVSPDLLSELDRLKDSASVPIKDLSVEDILRIRAAVKNLSNIQRLRDQVQAGIRRTTIKGLVDLAETKIQGMKLKAKEMEPGFKGGLGFALRKLLRNIKAEGRNAFDDFSYNAEMMFHDKQNDLYQVGAQAPYFANAEIEPYIAKGLGAWTDWEKAHGLDARVHFLKYRDYYNHEFTITDPETGRNYHFSRDEMFSAYMHFQAENNKKSLLSGAGFESSTDPDAIHAIPEAVYQNLFKNITEDEHALLDNIVPEVMTKFGDDMGKAHEERYNFPMAREDHYWTKSVMHVGADGKASVPYEKAIEADANARRFIQASPDMRRTIQRTGHVGPIYLRGFTTVMNEAAHDAAHVSKMLMPATEAARIWWNPRISSLIKQRFGVKSLAQAREDLQVLAGQGQTPEAYRSAFDFVGNVTSILDLTMGVKSAVKQVLLGARSAVKVGPQAWFRALVRIAKDPKAAHDHAMAISNNYSTASRRGTTVEQTQLRNQPGNMGKALATRRALTRAGMFLNRKASQAGLLLDTITADERAKIELENARQGKSFTDDFKAASGWNEEDVRAKEPGLGEKMAAAGRYADTVIGETHALANRAQELGLQKHAITRLMFKFKSEPFKGFQEMRRTWIQAKRNPTGFNIRKAVGSAVYYLLIEGAQAYGLDWLGKQAYGIVGPKKRAVKGKVGKPEPSELQSLAEHEVLGDLDQVPVVGDVANTVESLMNRPTSYSGSAGGQVGDLLARSIANIREAAHGKDPVARQRATKRIIENAFDLATAAMGFSTRSLRTYGEGIYRKVKGE